MNHTELFENDINSFIGNIKSNANYFFDFENLNRSLRFILDTHKEIESQFAITLNITNEMVFDIFHAIETKDRKAAGVETIYMMIVRFSGLADKPVI